MGMAVTRDNTLAISISADHLLCRYNLNQPPGAAITHPEPLATKYPGNGAVAFRADGRVIGVAGWDGAVRLYSTGQPRPAKGAEEPPSTGSIVEPHRKMRPLGTLDYFKESCFAVAFANEAGDSLGSEAGEDGSPAGPRWLAVGGKNGRVAIWELDSLEKRRA